jgi:hypothetical protein
VRVLVFILSLIVATVFELGATLLIVVTAPPHVTGLFVLPSAAVGLIVYGAMVLGSVSAYWDTTTSPNGRKYFRLWLIIVPALQALGLVATVVYVVLSSAQWWLPVVLLAAAALLDLGAIAVGRLVFRREQANRPILSTWNPITSRAIARKCGAVAITFVVALTVGLTLFLLFGQGGAHPLSLLAVVLEFAFLAPGFACIVVTIPLNRQMRDALGRDLGMVRTVSRVVLRNKKGDLGENEQVAAAKYAVIISVILSFTLAYISLLYVAIATLQLAQLHEGDPLSFAYLLVLVAVLIVLFPLQIVRIRRARRYARDHADKLPAPVLGRS